MKKKTNKYLKTTLSLSLGLMMLTGAVFANYENASGYGACKKALKNLAYSENYTLEYEYGVLLDGEGVDNNTIEMASGVVMLNVGGNPSSLSETTYTATNGGSNYNISVKQDDMSIYQYRNSDLDGDSGFISNSYRDDSCAIYEMSGGDTDTADKLVGFIETLADTFVGDLKNSFVMTSDENGTKTYNISLSREQMPSYVTSGVALVTSIMRKDMSDTNNTSNSSDDPTVNLVGSGEPYIKDVTGTMVVDENGNPSSADFEFNFVGFDKNGEEHCLTIYCTLNFRDFGTTEIERVPDDVISTLEDNRNPEWTKDEPASIDAEAIEESSSSVIGGVDGPTAVYVAP